MTDMTDYGEGHDPEKLAVEGKPEVKRTPEELREEKRKEVIAACSRCASAQQAGYLTCASHRLVDFSAVVWGHAYVTHQGAGHDVEMTTERNAMRTWRPQVVHYHESEKPCNEKCHQVFPNDLPYWGGSNIG